VHVVAFVYQGAGQEAPELGCHAYQNIGWVEAPDAKAAELAAVKAFTLNEWQRKRLLVRGWV
jgi:hypothetical protein